MSELWRILLVEDDDTLNQNIVNSLRKDGYSVLGVRSGSEAIRMVWSEEYDVVIGDLKMPGADGFELLQWLRTYRPKTRMIMIASAGSATTRTQALEAGVVSYLEKPLDLHLLKEELRRLLQQTGFSASLDSFDLLDVIQIITMSRKSIALLVNTGLEERGILRFQGGELIWAEYGILRGEEAFFALAAHKNGTVTHQHWNEQITPNVMQPLSRLIFQALQYRSKYAEPRQQPTGEQQAIPSGAFSLDDEVDDSPFAVLVETDELADQAGRAGEENARKEWWQPSEKIPSFTVANGRYDYTPSLATETGSAPPPDGPVTPGNGNSATIVPSTVRKTTASQRNDLPGWLTEQPTKSDLQKLRPSSLSSSAELSAASTSSTTRPAPAEWQPPPPTPQARSTEQVRRKQATEPQKRLARGNTGAIARQTSSPEWQPPEHDPTPSGSIISLSPSRKVGDALAYNEDLENTASGIQRAAKRNYPALVAALRTLGYSITGFIAAAVVSLDGQPIAQVAVDDLDISTLCGHFSGVLQCVLQSLEQGGWGDYEDTVITSVNRHILLRLVGGTKETFQVLITTRESDPVESLEVMANVEGAIATALH